MRLPRPEPGLVISYAYLWHREHRKGRDEGGKDRPCVIVLAVETSRRATRVTVAPITHVSPLRTDGAVELPAPIKSALGLDEQRSWVVVDEVNQFDWPGYDVRPIGRAARSAYGFVPPALFNRILSGIREQIARRKMSVVQRD